MFLVGVCGVDGSNPISVAGEPKEARSHLARALEQAHSVGDYNESLNTAETIAQLYRLEGRYYQSARHYAAANYLRERVRLARTWFAQTEYEAGIGELRRELGDETFEQAAAEGDGISLDELVEQSMQSPVASDL